MYTVRDFFEEYWPIALVFLICLIVFAADSMNILEVEIFLDRWLMVPADVSASWKALLSGDFSAEVLLTLATTLSSAFMHGDAAHIGMNLLMIWIFGSLVLRELGAFWFLLVFLVTAITGSVGQTLLDPDSPIPTLGASGALMGLQGVYLSMALRWRLPNPDVWPIAEPIPPERLIILAAIGVVMDVSGIIGQSQGIAYGAHLGGIVGGIVLGTSVIPVPKQAR